MKSPIASQARLAELGLEKAKYPSCSEPLIRSVQNRGRQWENQGCDQHGDCPWRDGTMHMEQRDETDDKPRPRNVVYKHIIPRQNGPGDVVINRYCACFQFLAIQKKRDGLNGEVAEVVGGEGDTVRIKVSKKTVDPDGMVHFTPEAKEVTVPRFPDPTEVPDLFEDVNAGRDRVENKQRTVDAERARRLGKAAPDLEFTKGIPGPEA